MAWGLTTPTSNPWTLSIYRSDWLWKFEWLKLRPTDIINNHQIVPKSGAFLVNSNCRKEATLLGHQHTENSSFLPDDCIASDAQPHQNSSRGSMEISCWGFYSMDWVISERNGVVVKKPCRFAYHFTDYQHFTLQNSRFSLYKIEEFHLQIVKTMVRI